MFDHVVVESIDAGVAVEVFRPAGLDLSAEAQEEAFQIAVDLDLEAQAETYLTDVSAVAWPVLSKLEQNVYGALFRRVVDLDQYDAPIPLTVLREIERAKKVEVAGRKFESFRVLCPVDSSMPDSVLIATLCEPGKTWSGKMHIIARWGSSLLPFDALVGKARDAIAAAALRAKLDAERELSLARDGDPSTWDVSLGSRWAETSFGKFEGVCG